MIWTRSARLYSLLAGLLVILAVIFGRAELFVPGLLLSVWVGTEFLVFYFCLNYLIPRQLKIHRESAAAAENSVIWSGTRVNMELRVSLEDSPLPILLSLEEQLPHGLKSEFKAQSGKLSSEQPWTLNYSIQCPQAGQFNLDGFYLTFFSPSALFYAFEFQTVPQQLKVYPNIFGWGQSRPNQKQWNAMLQLGRHRYAHKGGNSELLEIRDYQRGDSPKRIAWRLSARRDRILVKELERSVPLRTWIMIDAPSTTYLGQPGDRTIDKVFHAAGQLTRTLINDRDPLGVAFINAEGSKVIHPSTAQRQLFRVLGEFCELATKQPVGWLIDDEKLSEQIEAWLQRRFPRLLQKQLNVAHTTLLPFLTRKSHRRHTIEQHLAAVMAVVLGYPLDAAFGLTSVVHDREKWSQLCAEFYRHFNLQFELDILASVKNIPAEQEARLSRWRRWLALRQNQAHDNEVWVIFLGSVDQSYHEFLKVFKVARARGHRLIVIAEPANLAADETADLANQPNFNVKRVSQNRLFRTLHNAARVKDFEHFKGELKKLAIPLLQMPTSIDTASRVARKVLQLKSLKQTI